MLYDLLIIGAGPAGMNAAIYAKRAGKSVGIIEKAAPGGKLVNIQRIDNYIGVLETTGIDLSLKMFKQVEDLGVEYIYGDVKSIEKTDSIFNVDCGEIYKAKKIIVASGTGDKKTGIKGEDKYAGLGISYCATCDGALYKNKPMAILGGRNQALEEALYLSNLASKIYYLEPHKELIGTIDLKNKVIGKANIEIITDVKVEEIKGKEKVNEVVTSKGIFMVDVIFLFGTFGPLTQFLPKEILDDRGYLIVNDKFESKIPGLFGAGDVIQKELRQIVTAASDGAIAATNAIKGL